MSAPKKIVLPDGRVRYRIVYDAGRDPETGKRRQITKTFDRKRDADAELARVRHERNRGVYVPPSGLTVNDLLDSHLEAACFGKEAATRSNYAHAQKPARQFLGERLAQSVTREDVQRLRDWMMTAGRKRGGKPGTGLGARSVRLTISRLSAAYDLAVDDQRVTRNPCRRVDLPHLPDEERVTWSAEEAQQFLDATATDRLYAAWLMAVQYGMRRGEICGLRWEGVDLHAGTLAITTTRPVVDGHAIDKNKPKSKRSLRVLPLADDLAAVLAALRKRQAAEKLAAGTAYSPSGYVVVDELGEPINPEWLSDEFERLGKAAGLPRLTPQGARHTANSLMAARGIPEHIRGAWHGHSGEVNKRVYTHARPEDLLTAMGALSQPAGG